MWIAVLQFNEFLLLYMILMAKFIIALTHGPFGHKIIRYIHVVIPNKNYKKRSQL